METSEEQSAAEEAAADEIECIIVSALSPTKRRWTTGEAARHALDALKIAPNKDKDT